SYRVDHVNTFEFDGFFGLASVKFQNVRALGTSVPAGATVDASGAGAFPALSTKSSGRGTRVDDDTISTSSTDQSYTGTNGDPVQITVDWANRSCAMSGALVGSVEDRSGTATVSLSGTIVNQPPTANAGPNQTVECTSAAGASTALDASG